jgi:alkaline phosphatase D
VWEKFSRFLASKRNVSSATTQFLLPAMPPMPTRTPTRIAFGSCSSPDRDLSYWNRIHALEPDLFLFLGDNVYRTDGGTSLQDSYRHFAQNADVRRALSKIPVLATLDDNDYNVRDTSVLNNKSSRNLALEQAKTLFLDFFQVDEKDERRRPGRGVYTSYEWQNELQIILLDVRYHASEFCPNKNGVFVRGQGPYEPTSDPDMTLLGREQWEWLEKHFERPAAIRLLVSPIQVIATGHTWDAWQLFPHERERLLSLIDSASHKTLVILSGDRHFAAFAQQSSDSNPGATPLTEIMSSSLTHSVPSKLLRDERDPSRMGESIHVNNFGLLEIDWSTKTILASIRQSDTGEVCPHKSNPLTIA